ncbi:hypothetical protein D9M70_610040 [compost metagenome]
MVQEVAKKTVNGNQSFGFRTARRVLAMCGKKGACPTESVPMIKHLVDDKAALADIMADMFEIQAAAEKEGAVVADM